MSDTASGSDQFGISIENTGASAAAMAITYLSKAITASNATTVMGLQVELKELSTELIKKYPRYRISIQSGSELFMKFVLRASIDVPDFNACKALIIERGNSFLDQATISREKLSELAQHFVKDGYVVLVHSFSRAVVKTLLLAHDKYKKQFSVIATESLPDVSGRKLAETLSNAGIPVSLIHDAAIGFVMERVHMVMVGAEGVVESGGIINKIGTYTLSIVAKQNNKPFYVVAESFKFTRLYPLSQADVAASFEIPDATASTVHGVPFENQPIDYTPPSNITLLCTDIGVFTPSAVSDELIKVYSLS